MNKLRAIFVVALLFALPFSFFGCKAEPETTTVTSTISVNQTITLTSTYTASPQTTTKTEVKTVTETVSKTATTDTTTKPVTTTTKPITTTETRTDLAGVELEIQYVGMAQWDFVISDIIISASPTEVFVKFNVNTVYRKNAFVYVEYYDANEVLIGTSQTVEVKIAQAGSAKTTEIPFSIDNPSKISKIILVVDEE